MTRLIATLTSFLLVFLLSATGALAKEDPEAVHDRFVAARDALAAGDGPAVLTHLSEGTRKRLDEIRLAARGPGGISLDRLGPTEKIVVLSLRRFLTPAQLRHLNTDDVVGQVLTDGWLPPGTVGRSELGPVAVKGDRAGAVIKVDGKPTLVRAEFIKEANGWRIDLVRLIQMSDQLVRLFATAAGRTEEEFIADLIKRTHKPQAAP